MPITYPLIIPGSIALPAGTCYPGTTIPIPNPPGPNKANLTKYDAVGENISPFSGSAQQQQFQDQHWELELDWPEMTWPQFAPIDAFAGALHGKLGTFVWGPPLASGPQGSGLRAGRPVATGADLPLSNSLHTSAWLPNQTGLLLPGDFVGIPPNALLIEALQVASDGFISIQGSGAAPPWLGLGSAIWVAGTGLADGGPFAVVGFVNLLPGWLITLANTSGFAVGYAYQGTVGEAAGASATIPRLYQYVNPNPLASDGGGNATLDIFPCIREAPIAGATLALLNPQGTFRLADNRRGSPADKTKTILFKMKCREAI